MNTSLNVPLHWLSHFSRVLNNGLFFCGATALLCMGVVTFCDVLLRYLMTGAMLGAIEMVELLQVVLIFGALPLVQTWHANIRVGLVVDQLSPALRLVFEAMCLLVALLLFVMMTWCLYGVVLERAGNGERSMMLGIPIYVYVLCACIGAGSMALTLLTQLLEVAGRALENRWLPHLCCGLVAGLCIASLFLLIKAMGWNEHLLLLGGLGMAFMLMLLLAGLPIGIAMAGVGYLGLLSIYPDVLPANATLGSSTYTTAAFYPYSVVPMFILMGEFAKYSGISREMFNAANIWLGRLPGGLGVASVAGCAGFSAVSGDSIATAVTMASVALPEMDKLKYDKGFACATLAAGGTLGILIPPSAGFIFYSLVTEESIGKLFIAGIIPGLLLAVIFIAVVIIKAIRHPELAPRGVQTTWKAKLVATKGVIAMLCLILLILGGILGGIFSPNEGGAVGAMGTLLYALARRQLSFAQFWEAMRNATKVTAGLLLILVGVGLLSSFFAATALPFELADMVIGMDANRYVILAGILVFYIILGAMVNVIPMILLTLPAIFPSVVGLGFDPIWFGVVCVVLMEMSVITPPVGMNVFVLSTVAEGVTVAEIYRNVLPFFFGMLLLIGLLICFPQLATWLPSVLF